MDVVLDNGESGSPGPHEAGLVRYLREVERSRLLTRDEERVLLQRARAGDRKALNDLITANMKWVVAVSGEFRDRGLSMGDLIAEGNLGLIRAALSFEPERGLRFTAYAIWWIRQGLERALAEQAREGHSGWAPASGARPAAERSAPAAAPRLSPEIRRALDGLPEPGRTVLKLFFGLGTPRPMSLAEIGKVLGVETGHAEQLKDSALQRLQRAVPDRKPA